MSESVLKTVAATANAEQNMELNGNKVENEGVRYQKYLTEKGTYEGPEVGGGDGINAYAYASPYNYKYIVRLDEKPVKWAQIKNLDPNIRATKGLYMIKYIPKGSIQRKKGRPFLIGQDLIRWRLCVSGSNYWHYLAKQVPEIGWLERNSTLTDNMFKLAKMHPGMSLWFSVKWDEYEAKIQTQLIEAEGKDTVTPFASSCCPLDQYKKLFKSKDKRILLRNWNEVLGEINAVEKSESVQKEMKEETGAVYDRSRKLSRDPVTGRFIINKEGEK